MSILCFKEEFSKWVTPNECLNNCKYFSPVKNRCQYPNVMKSMIKRCINCYWQIRNQDLPYCKKCGSKMEEFDPLNDSPTMP